MRVDELSKALDIKKWNLLGFDTYEGEFYPIKEFDTEAEARAAAQEQLKQLEIDQPTKTSGGQGYTGIQDRIFITAPSVLTKPERIYPAPAVQPKESTR